MPRVNNELKPKRSRKFNRPSVPKSKAFKVTQDNRLAFAKFDDLSVNELKFFYYVISKLDSLTDKDFEIQEIPIEEVLFNALSNTSDENFTYISKLMDRLSKRIIQDKTLIYDPELNRDVRNQINMAIFKRLQYTEGQAVIKYQLNDCLKPYLLGIKKNFLSYKFENIIHMESGYAIRIYQMLLSELKQNRNEVEMYLIYLQDVLCVPKSMYIYGSFKQKVLAPSIKEINQHTDILVDDEIETIKDGKKIVKIKFKIAFKSAEQRKEQERKRKLFALESQIVKPLEKLKGKNLDFPINENETKGFVYQGECSIDEKKFQVNIVLEELANPRNKIVSHLKDIEDVEKLKTMHKQYEYKFFSKNKKLILANKDGSGLAWSHKILEDLKKPKETKEIEKEKEEAIVKGRFNGLVKTTPSEINESHKTIEEKKSKSIINEAQHKKEPFYKTKEEQEKALQKSTAILAKLKNQMIEHTQPKNLFDE
ncbi:replication initiation protein [Helicobacter pylori]